MAVGMIGAHGLIVPQSVERGKPVELVNVTIQLPSMEEIRVRWMDQKTQKCKRATKLLV